MSVLEKAKEKRKTEMKNHQSVKQNSSKIYGYIISQKIYWRQKSELNLKRK